MECPERKSDEECNTEISSADPSRYFYLLIFMALLYLVFSPEEVPNELKRKGEITHKKLSNMLIVSSLYEKYTPRYKYLEIEKSIEYPGSRESIYDRYMKSMKSILTISSEEDR
jgi:hypothetical protein